MNRTRPNPVRFNFGAGPSHLPQSVHEKLIDAQRDFQASGLPVTEISHRDDRVLALIPDIEATLRSLLGIPPDYAVLICNFSASLHFSALPLNFLSARDDLVVEMSGYWSERAADEFEKTHPVWRFQAGLELPLRDEGQPVREALMGYRTPGFVYYCDNETIAGIEWPHRPVDVYGGVPCPLISDMSSNLLTRPVNIEAHSCIFASSQKTLGLPGLSVLIVRRELLGQATENCPRLLNYSEIAQAGSVLNTLPVLTLYAMKCMLDWVAQEGGVTEMEGRARLRSELMYSFIDRSECYLNQVPPAYRSRVNVPFGLKNPDQIEAFLAGAEARGLVQLRGHRSVGGLRASLYNGMPEEGVEALIDWMSEFEQSH